MSSNRASADDLSESEAPISELSKVSPCLHKDTPQCELHSTSCEGGSLAFPSAIAALDCSAEGENICVLQEARRARLDSVMALVKTYNKLAPFDTRAYNPAVLLW